MSVDKPRRKPGLKCPMFHRDVSKVCHECDWYMEVRGEHPQTGAAVDSWGCAISFLPLLMIENSGLQRETGAAVESFRNAVDEAGKDPMAAIRSMVHMGNLIREDRQRRSLAHHSADGGAA